MSGGIGVGVITCDRPVFLHECLRSLPDCYDRLVVVNDGKRSIKNIVTRPRCTVIEHEENRGVGISKNDALKVLLENGCEHLFLIEDDVAIIDESVFHLYINTAEVSGIHHLSYALAVPYNRRQDPDLLEEEGLVDLDSEPAPRFVCKYGSDVKVSIYHETSGVFTYFTRYALMQAGLHDERFYNACEHVDLTYRIIKAGLHPPFWYFADIHRSHQFIENQNGFGENRSIAADIGEWKTIAEKAEMQYRQKNGCLPRDHPDSGEDECLRVLEELRKKYGNQDKREFCSLTICRE